MNPNFKSRPEEAPPNRWLVPMIICAVLLLFFAILLPRPRERRTEKPRATAEVDVAGAARSVAVRRPIYHQPTTGMNSAVQSPEEIVASRLHQFAHNRREYLNTIARRTGKPIPAVVEQFFDALDRGDWDQIKSLFHEMAVHSMQYDYSTDPWPDVNPYWALVLDAYGPFEQAHLLPARQFLDYGNAALDSLRPGMVYIGGTDPGRFVVTMMNETRDGEHHMVLTQNALADGRYIDFLNDLYGNQMAVLTQDEKDAAFKKYMADAKQRLLHDQNFPDEPKQVRDGENVTIGDDGDVKISGQISVMAINELLIQKLIEKNPDLSFAMEESISMPSTYIHGAPLGSLIELNAQSGPDSLTPDSAAQSLAYWNNAAQQATADVSDADSLDQLKKMYSHEITSQGHLFAAQGLNDQAEHAFALAVQLCPSSPEAVFNYVQVLMDQKRPAEALRVAQTGLELAPKNEQLKDLVARVKAASPP
jgi:tetratricopeptide (TPR) repeat protein